MKPPSHLLKVGRDAFARYLELIPEYPHLAEALAEVDQLQRAVYQKIKAAKYDAADQRLYLTLHDTRLKLLASAGLTPLSAKKISGVAPEKPDQEADEDDRFLDS
jgi:hypothetical protein